MLKIEDIFVNRGRTSVLKGISIEIGKGEIVALIGANGAGKTTTLRTISGLLRPKSGCIRFSPSPEGAVDLTRESVEGIVRLGISHCPEGRQVFSSLTVRENLSLGAFCRTDREGVEMDLRSVFDLFPVLFERRGQAAGNLSGGEQMMLALGRALMARPKMLLLDEPSLGLAPLIVGTIFRKIWDLNGKGMTVLLVEQNAAMALELANRAYVLEIGCVRLSGTGKELARNAEVRQAYLGGAA